MNRELLPSEVANSITDGEWKFCVWVTDGEHRLYYVNGELICKIKTPSSKDK